MTSYIEGRVIRHLVRGLLDAGYAIDVNDNDGDRETHVTGSTDLEAIVAAIFNLDIDAGDYLLDCIKGGEHVGWVRLIEGNDAHVINDYTINLENVVAPTEALVDLIDDNDAKWLRDELKLHEGLTDASSALLDVLEFLVSGDPLLHATPAQRAAYVDWAERTATKASRNPRIAEHLKRCADAARGEPSFYSFEERRTA